MSGRPAEQAPPPGARSAMAGHYGMNLQRAKDPRSTVRRLWAYFLPYRTRLVLVTACVVLYSLLGLLGPWLMGAAIDRAISQRDLHGLQVYAAWMLATFIAGSGLQVLANWWTAPLSQHALRDLRRDLFGRLQTLPLSFFDKSPSGDLMSRLTNDVEAVNQAVSQNVTSLLASLLSMAGILAAMFLLDHWLALASLLVVPLMIWFTRFVAVYTRRGFQRLQKGLGALNAVLEESIDGQRVVKVFQRTEAVSAAFTKSNQEVYEAGVAANTYALLLMPLTTVLGNLFVIVLASLGGWLALEGLVTVGTIAAFLTYGQNFVQPLRMLSNLYNSIQAALAGAERVLEIIDTPPEPGLAGAAGGPGVTPQEFGEVVFDQVSFGYRKDAPVLQEVSLSARPGELIALVGPTGAGKTTLINLLTRFYELDAGSIRIGGVDLRQIDKEVLRRKLGLVLQDTFLFSASVLENLRYGRLDATDEEVFEAARLADADHFIRQLPQGYQTQLSERAGNLSQGQRQLLAIARTLLADPAILILDEATSSVDTRTEARLQQALVRLMRGRTSFVIAHRLSTIKDASQVLVIDGGRILERGTHASLLEKRGAYWRLYVAQFKGEEI